MQKIPLLYIVNVRIPTEKAHGVQIIHTCVELYKLCKQEGRDFELIVCDRKNAIQQDVFEYFNVSKEVHFPIKKIKTISLFWPFRISFFLQEIQFICKLQWYMFWKYSYKVIVYSRDEFILASLIFKVRNLFWESHEGKYSFAVKIVGHFLNGVVVISNGLKDFYTKKLKQNIIVAHDSVDTDLFSLVHDKESLKKEFDIPLYKKIVLYVGKFDKQKGVDTFAQASFLVSSNVLYIAVGDGPLSLNIYRNKQLLILPQTPYTLLSKLLQIADVLVIPNSAKEKVHAVYTSPMKLFAYMASGVPIVASNVPAICEVLNPESAYIFQADDADDLHQKVHDALCDPKSSKKSERAQVLVREYSWEKRGQKIFSFIQKHI